VTQRSAELLLNAVQAFLLNSGLIAACVSTAMDTSAFEEDDGGFNLADAYADLTPEVRARQQTVPNHTDFLQAQRTAKILLCGVVAISGTMMFVCLACEILALGLLIVVSTVGRWLIRHLLVGSAHLLRIIYGIPRERGEGGDIESHRGSARDGDGPSAPASM
jgi:hypothetical protein